MSLTKRIDVRPTPPSVPTSDALVTPLKGRRKLSEFDLGGTATVIGVTDVQPGDAIARRLRDLGFVQGETVRVVARAALGGDPLVVQIGFTRFALRRAEAARVAVEPVPKPRG